MFCKRVLAAFGLWLLVSQPARAETDPTAGLFVCAGKDGVKNIVNKPTGEDCQPYRRGLLTESAPKTATPAPALEQKPATPAKPFKPPHKAAATPEKAIPIPKPQPPLKPAPPPVVENVLFPPAENFTGTGSGELYQLFGIKRPEKIITSKTSQGKQIWMCPQIDGTPTIVESETPLGSDCQPLGRKESVAQKAEEALKRRGKPLVGTFKPDAVQAQESPAGEIVETDGVPQDIYRCLDEKGKANYVGENQRAGFKDCQFFSRSFAKAHQEFIRKATQKQNLAALAAAGVQKSALDYSIGGVQGLQCTGAGSIQFNGQSSKFNCATRSFDYTPGTSGGSVRLGAKQAAIAAHNLDYLNASGSCGGVVTSENGRVFHLEPTKDCPQTLIIEAHKIRRQVEKQLNINTSGAFKERQRALAAQINEIAREVGVDPFLVHAVISAESAYKTRARSHVGARGLMQLMPATARRFGVTDSYHTGQNIRGGATYLKWLLKFFKGNMELAIAAYNAGEGNVKKYGYRIPPFIETRAYVPKVMQYYRRYRNNPHEVGL